LLEFGEATYTFVEIEFVDESAVDVTDRGIPIVANVFTTT